MAVRAKRSSTWPIRNDERAKDEGTETSRREEKDVHGCTSTESSGPFDRLAFLNSDPGSYWDWRRSRQLYDGHAAIDPFSIVKRTSNTQMHAGQHVLAINLFTELAWV